VPHIRNWRTLPAVALLCVPASLHAAVPGFTPPDGWTAEPLDLQADVVAVASDGRLAVGSSSAGGALIKVYNHAAPAGRVALASVAASDLRYLGGLAFDSSGLLVSENGARDTVYHASFADGSIAPMAAAGSIPNVGEVGVGPDGAVYAVAANNPGLGRIYRLDSGVASVFADGLGVGYLGGLSFDGNGRILVADTNDPSLAGVPGRVLRLDGAGHVAESLDLTGGGGSGVYDVDWSNGAIFATTGRTLTRWTGGQAAPFGEFAGDFPFPTDIVAAPDGSIIVNGRFTESGGLFALRPAGTVVPEPGTLVLVGVMVVPLVLRRRPGG
jgi:hypothetical protein